MTPDRLQLLARTALAVAEAADWKVRCAMARIDDVETNVNRIKADVLKVVDVLRSYAAELQSLRDLVAANEEVDPARLDALKEGTGGIADALEQAMAAPPAAPPAEVPPPIVPPAV